jgi:AcrR family transcriptional regulator
VKLQPDNQEVNGRSEALSRRERQKKRTRETILESALDLFASQGFHKTTIKEIAERADVSEQTVYNAFDDKIGLLWNAGMMFLEAGGGEREVELMRALNEESDALERIRIVARDSALFWDEHADAVFQLERLGFDPVLSDPRLEELSAKSLEFQRLSTRMVCEILFPDEIRRRDLSFEDIVDYLTAVDSASTLTNLRNLDWSIERWEAWVVQLLSLFVEPGAIEGP